METAATPRDLPRWASLGLPLGSYLFIAGAGLLDPPFFLRLLAKDADGGLVEQATFLVLLPALAAGAALLLRHREKLRARGSLLWVASISAACAYFAGEEVSWGQWWFHWETPEALARINEQGETNLHNTSYWLNHGPVGVVHAWIAIGGVVLPLLRWWTGRPFPAPDGFAYCFWPTAACVPAACAVGFTSLPAFALAHAGFPELEQLGRSEMVEYLTAIFLCLYLVSLWWRLRQLDARDGGNRMAANRDPAGDPARDRGRSASATSRHGGSAAWAVSPSLSQSESQ